MSSGNNGVRAAGDGAIMKAVVEKVQRAAAEFGHTLTVAIGEVEELTGLKATQIRHLEKYSMLRDDVDGAQNSQETGDGRETGERRHYRLQDLRRLKACAVLMNEHDKTPREAADLVVKHASAIDGRGRHQWLSLMHREDKVARDGFLLSRLATHLLYAVQCEFDQRFSTPTDEHIAAPARESGERRVAVVGVVLVERPDAEGAERDRARAVEGGKGHVDPAEPSDAAGLQLLARDGGDGNVGTTVVVSPNLIIAVDRTHVKEDTPTPPPVRFPYSGEAQDESTVLFYCSEEVAIPCRAPIQLCWYTPHQHSCLQMVLLVSASADAMVGKELAFDARHPRQAQRQHTLDRLLRMCGRLYPRFRDLRGQAQDYHYRSDYDGYLWARTSEAYGEYLERVRELVFAPLHDELTEEHTEAASARAQSAGPDTDARTSEDFRQSMAVIFVPDRLSRPNHLIILAQSGYPKDLVNPAAKLDLDPSKPGAGQGMSGRAYRRHEPLFTLRADAEDSHVTFQEQELSRVAMAVPLHAKWANEPFGVLYLATGERRDDLASAQAYSESAFAALILGNILSELLGYWWITRLRRITDQSMHRQSETYIHWLAGLDRYGPDLQRGIAALAELCKNRVPPAPHAGAPESDGGQVALVVLAIDEPAVPHLETPDADGLGYEELLDPRRSVEPVVMVEQAHVERAIKQIADRIGEPIPDWWFDNDHTLLLLDGKTKQEVRTLVKRIQKQVEGQATSLRKGNGEEVNISVRAAIKMLTYQELDDLLCDGATATVNARALELIKRVHRETQRMEPRSLTQLPS